MKMTTTKNKEKTVREILRANLSPKMYRKVLRIAFQDRHFYGTTRTTIAQALNDTADSFEGAIVNIIFLPYSAESKLIKIYIDGGMKDVKPRKGFITFWEVLDIIINKLHK